MYFNNSENTLYIKHVYIRGCECTDIRVKNPYNIARRVFPT